MFNPLPSSLDFIRSGKLRALAVTSATSADALPDVPTVAEFVPGYEATAWFGIGAPKATPAEIVDKLNTEINAGLADPQFKARLIDLGGVPTADVARRLWQAHRRRNRKVGQGCQVGEHQAGMISEVAALIFDTGAFIMKLPRANFCIWQRALPRSLPSRASQGRKLIHRGRCTSSSVIRQAA